MPKFDPNERAKNWAKSRAPKTKAHQEGLELELELEPGWSHVLT